MAYQALYRKFRPADFSEVYGQDHIVTALKNQLKSGRIGHAYVFSGTRGTGKTSVAKIFAKALNCQNPDDSNPCGTCASCAAINDGSAMHVREIDAASNNGVDSIREIIEDVSYPPITGKYKVYIIDEAHMVTSQAFNALLKTIEEPPEYAVFILATTEVIKIPITILSRCQRYDFHRITVDMIAKRMEELKNAEGISIEDRALRYIARLADGSMRDALSIFDQCISYFYGQDITYDMTLAMLGSANTEMFSKLFRAVNSHDAKTAIDIAEEAIVRGMEPETFVSDFTWYLRNLLLVKNGERLEDVADISTEDSKTFLEEVDIAEEDFIMRSISVMSELLGQIRFSTVKRISLETGLIRLCRPQMESDYGAILDRVRMLEQRGYAQRQMAPIQSDNEGPAFKNNYDMPKVPKRVPEQATQVVPDKASGNVHAENFAEAKAEPISEPTPETVSGPESKPVIAMSVPGGIGACWDSFLSSMPQPDKSMTMKAVVIQTGEASADIYFEKKSAGSGFYSKEASVKRLNDAIDAFVGGHTEIQIKIVEPGDLPQGGSAGAPSGGSEEFFKHAALTGVKIEIE